MTSTHSARVGHIARLLLAGLSPIACYAQSPISITNAAELQAIQSNLSGSYVLSNDVAIGSSFTPLGSASSPFTGSLNGAGHAISGLTVATSTGDIGLFGQIGSSGNVSDLRITGANLQGSGSTSTIGVLAGVNAGTVSHVHVQGVINTPASGQFLDVGGLIGNNAGNIIEAAAAVGVTVSNTNYLHLGGLIGYNSGALLFGTASGAVNAINGSNNNGNYTIGGLLGSNTGSATLSSATGAVVGTDASGPAGGLAGFNSGSISRSYARGATTAFLSAAGLVGWNNGGHITDSYATGAVGGTSGDAAGGLVELDDLGGTIATSYAVGALSGSAVGGLVDRFGYGGGTVTSSYWDIQATGTRKSAAGTGRNTAELTSGKLPSGFDSTVWEGVYFAAVSPAIGYYPQLWLPPFSISQFPLPGYTAYSIPIITVFDHSPETAPDSGILALYSGNDKCDQIVLAFDGSMGQLMYGSNESKCSEAGYRQASQLPFLPSVTYIGDTSKKGGGSKYLNYEGHPGYDYEAPLLTEVDAAVSGVVFYPWKAIGTGDNYDTYCRFHTLAEIPDSAANYRIYYLHLTTHPARVGSASVPYCNYTVYDNSGSTISFNAQAGCYTLNGAPFMPSTLPLPEGTHVNAGCQIALSGNAGVKGAHLHFEIQRIVPSGALTSEATAIDYFHCWNENLQYTQKMQSYCLPADPYGWIGQLGADTWGGLTGVPSVSFWTP